MIYTAQPDLNKKETARYLGYGASPMDAETEKMAEEMHKLLAPTVKIWHTECDVKISDNTVYLSSLTFESKDLAKNLKGATKAVLFGATLGLSFDRLLQKTEITSPAKAAVLQAVGTAAIEEGCDMFCATFGKTRPRFSPGYGDLSLSAQKDIFNFLDLERRLGVTLTQSLLMVPKKSVTAILGMGGNNCVSGCNACTHPCTFRKEE